MLLASWFLGPSLSGYATVVRLGELWWQKLQPEGIGASAASMALSTCSQQWHSVHALRWHSAWHAVHARSTCTSLIHLVITHTCSADAALTPLSSHHRIPRHPNRSIDLWIPTAAHQQLLLAPTRIQAALLCSRVVCRVVCRVVLLLGWCHRGRPSQPSLEAVSGKAI